MAKRKPPINPFEVDRHDPHNYTPNPHYERKDKGQGTLFATQRYERGYGPARQQRVNEALMSTERTALSTVFRRHKDDVDEAADARQEKRLAGVTPQSAQEHVIDVSKASPARRRMVGGEHALTKGRSKKATKARELSRGDIRNRTTEVLKKSTMPAQHLEGLKISFDDTGGYRGGEMSTRSGVRMRAGHAPTLSDEGRRQLAEKGASNKYRKSEEGYALEKPSFDTTTLRHEIGHHVGFRSPSGIESLAVGVGPQPELPSRAESKELSQAENRAANAAWGRTHVDNAHFSPHSSRNFRETVQKPLDVKNVRKMEGDEVDTRFAGRQDRDSTGIGMVEAFADDYAARHGASPNRGYGPDSIELNVKNQYKHKYPELVKEEGGVAQNVKLGQKAYVYNRTRMDPDTIGDEWDHLRAANASVLNDEQQQLSMFPGPGDWISEDDADHLFGRKRK